MRRGGRLNPGKPLTRKTPLKAKSAPKGKRASTGPARDVVDAVLERGAHSCEICSAGLGPVRGVDYQIHHRRPRAMGGTDRPETNWPSNLLLLCPADHEAIESRRAEATEAGWLVPQTSDPAQIPVLIRYERWVYLAPDGTYSTHPPRREGDP